MHGEIRFFDPTGQPMPIRIGASDPTPVFEYEIAPRSFSKFQTNGTVSTTNEETGEVTVEPVQVGSVQVVPFPGSYTPGAHAILSWNVANITVFQTPVEAQLPTKTMRFYAETSGATFDFDNPEIGSVRSAVAVANPGPQAATVRFDLTRIDGTPTELTGQSRFQVQEQYANFVHQIPGFENLPTEFKGVLKVSAVDVPGVTALGMREFFKRAVSVSRNDNRSARRGCGDVEPTRLPAHRGRRRIQYRVYIDRETERPGRSGHPAVLYPEQGLPFPVTKKPQ